MFYKDYYIFHVSFFYKIHKKHLTFPLIQRLKNTSLCLEKTLYLL